MSLKILKQAPWRLGSPLGTIAASVNAHLIPSTQRFWYVFLGGRFSREEGWDDSSIQIYLIYLSTYQRETRLTLHWRWNSNLYSCTPQPWPWRVAATVLATPMRHMMIHSRSWAKNGFRCFFPSHDVSVATPKRYKCHLMIIRGTPMTRENPIYTA